MMRFISSLLLWFMLTVPALALDVPALQGHINDYAGMLSPTQAATLEQQLRSLEQSDSTQIVVLTIPTLAGENLEEFSIKTAETWKIGHRGTDNGVILLIAKAERKVRIEVGRGLEGKLTDLVAGRIIRGDIAPQFKAGRFDDGIMAGVKALIDVTRGEYKAKPRDLRHGKKGAPPLLTLIVFLAVAAVFCSSFSKYLSGTIGAIGLPVIGWLTFPGLALVLLAALAVGGFFFGLLLAFLFGGGSSGHFGGPYFGGGYFGGGSGTGGDSGGFSGGGGDFGGGGASGDW